MSAPSHLVLCCVCASVCVSVCQCVAATSSVLRTNQLRLKTEEQPIEVRPWWPRPSHDAFCFGAVALHRVLWHCGCQS